VEKVKLALLHFQVTRTLGWREGAKLTFQMVLLAGFLDWKRFQLLHSGTFFWERQLDPRLGVHSVDFLHVGPKNWGRVPNSYHHFGIGYLLFYPKPEALREFGLPS